MINENEKTSLDCNTRVKPIGRWDGQHDKLEGGGDEVESKETCREE